MSVLSSISNALTTTFDTVTAVATTAQETVGMATEYVHNRAHSQKLTDKQAVIVSTAKALQVHKQELDADEELKALYDELEKDWN